MRSHPIDARFRQTIELEFLGTAMRHRIKALLLLFFLLVLWESACRLFSISPLILPAPTAVFERLIELIKSGEIWPHLLATLTSVLAGFVIGATAAMVLGCFISLLPTIEQLAYSYLVAFQTIPKIAVAPLFILWFGYGIASKIVISALMCFFPVLVAVIAGFHNVEHDRLDMLRSLGATRWQTILRLRIPSALVLIFAGLEVAAVMSVIGAIVGEFVGAQQGLGYLITTLNFNLDVAGVFAVLVVLSAIGLVLHALVKVASRKLVFWHRREQLQLFN
jgi:NitT/TauT family transport system permease protein